MSDDASAELTPKLVDSLYVEAMVLADEARSYFDSAARDDRLGLEPVDRVGFSCESLKVTTRLMHVIAWLLTQRAVTAGELTRAQAGPTDRWLGAAPSAGRAGGSGRAPAAPPGWRASTAAAWAAHSSIYGSGPARLDQSERSSRFSRLRAGLDAGASPKLPSSSRRTRSYSSSLARISSAAGDGSRGSSTSSLVGAGPSRRSVWPAWARVSSPAVTARWVSSQAITCIKRVVTFSDSQEKATRSTGASASRSSRAHLSK